VEDFYFIIEMNLNDNMENSNLIFYTNLNNTNGSSSNNRFHTLFPCNWCAHNNLYIVPPKDWSQQAKEPFNWDIYINKIKQTSPSAYQTHLGDLPLFNWSHNLGQLSEKFQLGMYLECGLGEKMQLTQVKAKIGHLIFLSSIAETATNDDKLNFITPVDSINLYPIGWCEMNNFFTWSYPSDEPVESEVRHDLAQIPHLSQFNLSDYWCVEPIYINTQFQCGPYLLKAKLSTLPKCFGPGPIVYVVQRLIQMLLSRASDKPFKMLKALKAKKKSARSVKSNSISANSSSSMQRLPLKAKEKGKYDYRELDICTKQGHLREYLNDLCIKLKCCNKLLSLEQFKHDEDAKKESTNCINLKCCELCTINYFSHWSDLLNEHLNNESLSSLPITTATTTTTTSTTMPVNTNPANHTNNNINPQPNGGKRKPMARNQPDKDSTYADNFSPIKTRLNVRQSLIYSMRQEELARQQQELLKKKADPNEATVKLKRLQSTDPPIEKKLKKSVSLIIENDSKKKTPTTTTTTTQHRKSIELPNSSQMSTSQFSLISNANMSNIVTNHNQRGNTDNLNCNNEKPAVFSDNSNPILWSASDVCKYLVNNKFDSSLVYLIQEHEIDGQSFLMLNLPTIQNYMNLKLGPAIKLAHLVEKLKLAYFQNFKQT
jgi:hypothetical protein